MKRKKKNQEIGSPFTFLEKRNWVKRFKKEDVSWQNRKKDLSKRNKELKR